MSQASERSQSWTIPWIPGAGGPDTGLVQYSRPPPTRQFIAKLKMYPPVWQEESMANARCQSSVADLDPVLFWPQDPGSGIPFFRIPDPIHFSENSATIFGLNSWGIKGITAKSYKKGKTTNLFFPLLFLVCWIWDWKNPDPGWKNPDPQHCVRDYHTWSAVYQEGGKDAWAGGTEKGDITYYASLQFALILSSIPASSDTAESEGRQMKQYWITYIKNEKIYLKS